MGLEEIELNDANYTWTDDPFGPEYEIIQIWFEMGLVHVPRKFNYVVSQDIYFPDDK